MTAGAQFCCIPSACTRLLRAGFAPAGGDGAEPPVGNPRRHERLKPPASRATPPGRAATIQPRSRTNRART